MNPPDEIQEKIITLLQDIGATDSRESRVELKEIQDAHNILWDLLRSLNTDADQLELVIRGLCRIEAGSSRESLDEPLFSFGSTTEIPHLLKRYQAMTPSDPERADNLTDWLLTNRRSTYIPFGYQVPLGINSREEYRDYEERRAKHREEKLAVDQEAHRAAVARKLENARLHAERSAINRLKSRKDS